MNKYGLHGKIKAISGSRDKLIQTLLDASKLISTAKGCDIYLISKDKIDNDSVWVTEVWESKEDHDNSLKLENIRILISKAMPLIDGTPEKGQELEVLGGKGMS